MKKFQLPSVFTSLIGQLGWQFQDKPVEITRNTWPTGAEKVFITISKPIVLRNAQNRLPVQVESGAYVALRQPEGIYGFNYVDKEVMVNATEKFWSERVDLGFVTVAGR